MSATRKDNYFDNFSVGDVFHHRRGRTLYQEDNVHWSLATLNTAQAHWNIESMKSYLGGQFDRPILNAAIVLALAAGLTSEDMSENILADVGIDKVCMRHPVFPGDTLTAMSTILDVRDFEDDPRCGLIIYAIEATNQREEQVCTFVRSILVKKRSFWALPDELYSNAHWPATVDGEVPTVQFSRTEGSYSGVQARKLPEG
jgi:acyl dehydratase